MENVAQKDANSGSMAADDSGDVSYVVSTKNNEKEKKSGLRVDLG